MRKQKAIKYARFGVAALAGYVAVVAIFRRRYLNWGATEGELQQPLPGDELMHHPAANHAITIHAPVEAVWPWLVQIGQDKAGFYSYSFLENLVRADIHNADRIMPEWQHLKTGDTIRLGSKKVYGDTTLLRVAALEENHFIVLERWGAFVLKPLDEERTRLLIRSHGRKLSWMNKLLAYLLLDPIHFVMERGMLLGIKQRAEHQYLKQGRS